MEAVPSIIAPKESIGEETPVTVNINENGNAQPEKVEMHKPEIEKAKEQCNSEPLAAHTTTTTKSNQADSENEKVLITICSADRKQKKAFMSIPKREDVIKKAKMYGLYGINIVLEHNGCEICEDEVLVVSAKEKCLLMLLAENEEYIPPPTPSQPVSATSNGSKHGHCSSISAYDAVDSSIVSNAIDSTLSNDETLSMTSVTPSNISKSKTIFTNFTIPWDKVPDTIISLLEQKSSLGKRLNTFANLLIDELRELGAPQIPSTVIRQVAQQVADKYPDSLLEKDREGHLIAKTPHSLISKMLNRNNVLNNSLKRSAGIGHVGLNSAVSSEGFSRNEFDIHFPPNKKRKTSNGNVAHSFGSCDQTATFYDNLVKKKNSMINYFCSDAEIDKETIVTYMKQCFPLQRAFFNNDEKIPDINAIKDNWPYIFDKDILYNHFERLMSIDPRKFETRFHSEKSRFHKLFKSSKNKKMNVLEATDSNVIRGLAYHFNEDSDFIFKWFDHGTTLEYIQNANPTNAPWVALIKNSDSKTEDEFTALLYIEGSIMVQTSSDKSSFVDIIAQLLCYYYTFNMMYPKEVKQTLEFIDIYILQDPPTVRNSGNVRKISIRNNKYNQLIAKLNSNC